MNSGSSERNGATHWTNTNWDTPRTVARPIMLYRNGWAVRKSTTPPTTNRPRMASFRHGAWRRITMRATAATSSISSWSLGGIRFTTTR